MYLFLKRLYGFFSKLKSDKNLERLLANGLEVGENVQIYGGFFFDPSHCFLISIGSYCTLAPNVRLIAHDASTKHYLGFTRIGRIDILENCFIGDSVVVLPGVTVGPNTIVGAGSVVTSNIPQGVVAAGNPAKVICSLDEYIKRQKELSESTGVLGEDYWIQNLSKKQMLWMRNQLQGKDGFIE